MRLSGGIGSRVVWFRAPWQFGERALYRTTGLMLMAITVGISTILLYGAYRPVSATVPPDSCFAFNATSGTILNYYNNEGNNSANPACTRAVDIPATIGGVPVRTIGIWSFQSSLLTAVTIPEGVETISDLAFAYNQIETVSIPDTVTSIGSSAFALNQLSTVRIPENVVSIGTYAFQRNALLSVSIPDSVSHIGDYAFANNSLISVSIPSNLTTLNSYVFAYNQIETATIPPGINAIGASAFALNRLETIEIPSGVTSIGNYAFQNNRLTNVTFPNSLRTIGEAAFSGNQLSGVVLQPGVTAIGGLAFGYNRIGSLTIPNSVTTIGSSAFTDNLLTELRIPSSVNSLGQNAFSFNRLSSVMMDTSSVSQAQIAVAFRYNGTSLSELGSLFSNPSSLRQYLRSNLKVIPVYTPNTSTQYMSLIRYESDLTAGGYNGVDLNQDGDLLDPAGGLLVNPAQLTVRYIDQHGNDIISPVSTVGPELTNYGVDDLLTSVGTRNITTTDLSDFYYFSGMNVSHTAPNIDGMVLTSPQTQSIMLQAGESNTISFMYAHPMEVPPESGSENNSGTGNSDSKADSDPTELRAPNTGYKMVSLPMTNIGIILASVTLLVITGAIYQLRKRMM